MSMEEAVFDRVNGDLRGTNTIAFSSIAENLGDFGADSASSSPRSCDRVQTFVCTSFSRTSADLSQNEVHQRQIGLIEAFFVRIKSFNLTTILALPAHDLPLLAVIRDLITASNYKVHLVPIARPEDASSVFNALLAESVRMGANLVLFQGMEVVFSMEVLDALTGHMDSNTLVVGGEIPGMHTFCEGDLDLRGETAPWNTFALWNPEKISLTGFLPLSDGLIKGVASGAEEVAAIALIQKLLPGSAAAKLIRVPGIALLPWQDGSPLHDPRLKMALAPNCSRQLAALGGLIGSVVHLDLTPLPPSSALCLKESSLHETGETTDGSDSRSAADTALVGSGSELHAKILSATREAKWIETHADNKNVMASYAASGIVSAADYFESVCDVRPDSVFVESVESGRSYSYVETDSLANQVAHWALSRAYGPGDAVALAMENCPRFLQIWLGLAKAGVTVACINTNISGDNLSHAVHVAKCRAAIVSSRELSKWTALGGQEGLGVPIHVSAGSLLDRAYKSDQLEEECGCFDASSRPDKSLRSSVNGLDPLFYIYTSGTTGRSKAAVFSHTRFIGAGVTWARAMALTPQDIFYVTLPLYHGNGGCVAVSAVLRSGARLVLREKFSVSNFLPDIRKHNCTATIYIGEMWRYLYNTPGLSNDADNPLRVACGNGLRSDIWRPVCDRFGISLIVEHYGQTEMPSAHPMINNFNVVGSCGYIPPSIRGSLATECLIRFDIESNTPVRDENGFCVRCRAGEEGESVVRLSTAYRGYTSEEAAQRAVYTNVFEEGDMWYHSGDLLRYDADGFFYFVDRVGDTFRWKGENVATGEVCEAVGSFSDVAEANVYGVSVPCTEGRAGMASIVLKNDDFDLELFYKHVVRLLPNYARPLFLCVKSAGSEEHEKTSTFKFKKTESQTKGFDPALCAPHHLYFRDDALGRYVSLDAALFEAISCGHIRL